MGNGHGSTREETNQIIADVADNVKATLIAKNTDYGDSFHKIFEKHGDLSTLIRLTDKMGRLENGVDGHEFLVTDESLDDIYKDIAGYCILTLVSKEKLRNEQKAKEVSANAMADFK